MNFYENLIEDGNQEAIRMFKMGVVNGLKIETQATKNININDEAIATIPNERKEAYFDPLIK